MRDNFIFNKAYYDAIKNLPDSNQLEVYRALCEAVFNGIEIEISLLSLSTYNLIKPNLVKNRKIKTSTYSDKPTEAEFMDYANILIKAIGLNPENYKNEVYLKYKAWNDSGWVNGRTQKKIIDWKATLCNTIKYITKDAKTHKSEINDMIYGKSNFK